MTLTVTQLYLISFGILYVMLNIILLIFVRKPIVEYVRQRFLIGRGYAYIRVNDFNNHIQEHFVKIKKDRVRIGSRTYLINPKRVRYKNKAPVYEYMVNYSEPLDVYDKNSLVGTDSEHLDGFLLKMKSLAKTQAHKEIQLIFWLTIGAIGCAAIAAAVSVLNYVKLDELVGALL